MQFEIFILAISLIGAIYSYFLYPLILLALPKKNSFEVSSLITNENELPFLSLIITAYNEESLIKEKIRNIIESDYPEHKREILVASDGSTDNTNPYVNEFSAQGVRLIEVKERKGKENAQLAAIKEAHGDILVFSDVATQIPKEALKFIAATFDNKKIGALSSEDRFITENGKIAGEGAYVKYEMWLRRLEASVNSLVGLSGSFFACRKSICNNWDINVPSDFNTALNCVSQGFVAISHPKVLGFYPNIKDESKEYQRKLRTVIRGMAAIAEKPSVLNPFKFGLFTFEVFSHKIMRWLVPWFQLALLISSAIAWQTHILIAIILAGQIAFYLLATIGWLSKTARSNSLIKLPFFFMQVNIAIAHAGIQFLSGKRITVWEPSKR
ncbi:Glycosyl transferase, group 2 family [hydrothermal vent metagenome]|uniref:Glycosyl transferase, group 2 family n=1 Tax=hydrothermal vent metagenome TaxID=652676 RepID=A0A3B1AVD2_9ZZZZ